jgi:hypothetical protein
MVSGAFDARSAWCSTVVHAAAAGYEYDAIVRVVVRLRAGGARGLRRADVRSQACPRALAGMADMPRSVFMFTQVTHSRP